jgi:hypothetical protein
MTNNFFLKQILRTLAFIGVIAGIHFFLLKNTLPPIYQKTSPWLIYLSMVPVLVLGLLYIYSKYLKDNTSVVKTFMLYTTLKMLSSLAFLSDWMINKTELTLPFVYQYFVIFFIILFAEIAFLVKMLKLEPAKSEKKEKIQE